MLEPEFKIVPRSEATKHRLPERPRRHWAPVIEVLITGQTLFMPDEALTEANVKYLQLALARRGKDEHLRTERTVRDGEIGRDLWVVHGTGPVASFSVVEA